MICRHLIDSPRHITRHLCLAIAFVAFWLGSPLGHVQFVSADEIGFVEDFAWSEDREAELKKLIPGTEDYYYYHCLHHQNNQRYDKAAEVLEAWRKRFDAGGNPFTNGSQRWQLMWNRQMLLTYEASPQRTLSHLTRSLSLRFDHKRERVGEKPNLPIHWIPPQSHASD